MELSSCSAEMTVFVSMSCTETGSWKSGRKKNKKKKQLKPLEADHLKCI